MGGFWENGRFVLRSTIEERAARKDKEIESLHAARAEDQKRIDRLMGLADCGTAHNFLQCSDDVKREYFAGFIRESERRKKAEQEAETAWAQAKRLAMELECLVMDTKDVAVVSKWWASSMEALDEFNKHWSDHAD